MQRQFPSGEDHVFHTIYGIASKQLFGLGVLGRELLSVDTEAPVSGYKWMVVSKLLRSTSFRLEHIESNIFLLENHNIPQSFFAYELPTGVARKNLLNHSRLLFGGRLSDFHG